MSDQISKIRSIELDRTTLFKHKILLKDEAGWILEEIPVKENNGWEVFKMIYEKWVNHPSYKGM